MSITVPTPEQTAPDALPDMSEADHPKPKTRLDKVANGVALACAGVALAGCGALGGLTYAQHAVDTWQAQVQRTSAAEQAAVVAVDRELAKDPSHLAGPAKYIVGARAGAADAPLEKPVKVYLNDANTGAFADEVDVTFNADGRPSAFVWGIAAGAGAP